MYEGNKNLDFSHNISAATTIAGMGEELRIKATAFLQPLKGPSGGRGAAKRRDQFEQKQGFGEVTSVSVTYSWTWEGEPK